MKSRRPVSIALILLIWFIIYILAMAIGAVVACLYTYEANMHLPELMSQDTQYYLENKEFTPKTYYYRTCAYIYSKDGQMLDSYTPSGSSFDFSSHAQEFIPMLIEKGSLYKMLADPEFSSWVGLVAGTTMENGDLYFLVRGQLSLQIILIVMFFSLTVFLIMSCIYSLIIVRKNQRMDAVQREYVANISHDLKSPIASIMALSESLYDGVVSPERQKKCIGLICDEAAVLEHTVKGILELSRAQSMGHSVVRRRVKPCDLFLPIVEKYFLRCDQMGIHFFPPESVDTLPDLYTDAGQINMLASSLLDNAVKFAFPGGHIWMTISIQRKRLVVCIADDGIGIEKSEQKRIFERFYTVDHARNKNGSGLGLAIADEIAKGLKEDIWVESTPGNGSAFYFTIKLYPA